MSESRNKRIAKNTMMLYVRMLFLMAVSLYTSRVVLSTLGVEDFGIYGVVGGIVALLAFLNASMSGATSRFLTFEMGRGDMLKLKDTFSSAVILSAGIALCILLLAETVGLWFVVNKLVIPPERMSAALWAYQFSILVTVVKVFQVPYNASIIAHERMGVYAGIEIVSALLQLGVIYLLTAGSSDKLILYAALIFAVSVVVFSFYATYCLRKFEECRFRRIWRPEILMPMVSFSGWDLYGNLSVAARTQGVNVLLNLFFGTVLNAANSVAVQVQGATMAFSNNIILAVRPQIVKSYAAGDYEDTVRLVTNTAKYTFLLLLVLSLPLILEMDFVLNLWLKNVPPHAVAFCRLVLMFNFFATMSVVVISAIHATGNIKRPSLINGTLYLSVVPISYIAFRFNAIPEVAYACNILLVFAGMLSNVYTLKLHLPGFSVKEFVVKTIGVCLFISAVSFAVTYFVMSRLPEGFGRLCMVTLVSLLVTVGMVYAIAMNRETKQYIKAKAVNVLERWRN